MTSKTEIRSAIKALKKQHSKEDLQAQSELIMRKLEQHPDFIKAQKIMLYSSLPDEVQTQGFIEKWRQQKRIILPTVVGDDIIPVELTPETNFAVGDFNILEPQNEAYTGGYDLIIVPGVAFDRQGNRMGRGRGYYDRFLCQHRDVKKLAFVSIFNLLIMCLLKKMTSLWTKLFRNKSVVFQKFLRLMVDSETRHKHSRNG